MVLFVTAAIPVERFGVFGGFEGSTWRNHHFFMDYEETPETLNAKAMNTIVFQKCLDEMMAMELPERTDWSTPTMPRIVDVKRIV